VKNFFVLPKPKKGFLYFGYMMVSIVILYVCVAVSDAMNVLSTLTEDAKTSLGWLFLFAYFAVSSMVQFLMLFVREDEE